MNCRVYRTNHAVDVRNESVPITVIISQKSEVLITILKRTRFVDLFSLCNAFQYACAILQIINKNIRGKTHPHISFSECAQGVIRSVRNKNHAFALFYKGWIQIIIDILCELLEVIPDDLIEEQVRLTAINST